MEFREIRCRSCGGQMHVPDGATHIRCSFCGTEYMLRKPQESPVKDIRFGAGTLFRAYVPTGWDCRVTEDKSMSGILPVAKGLRMAGPGGERLEFCPIAYYKNFTPGQMISAPGTFQKAADYAIDGWSLVCYRRLTDARSYAAERLMQTFGALANIQLTPEPDDALCKKLQPFPAQAAQQLGKPVRAEAYKFRVSFTAGGTAYRGLFATAFAVTDGALSARPAQQSSGGWMGMLQAGLGAFGGMLGGKVSSDWWRALDLMLVAPESANSDLNGIFTQFVTHLAYGPQYDALQDAERQNLQQIQMQGAMTRQQIAIRSSQQVSRTLSQTSDIVNSTIADHSARMNTMIDHSTDGIRGVETYTDSSGQRYEADVKYDHIYRSGDTFVGSTDGSLDLGPMWEELKK